MIATSKERCGELLELVHVMYARVLAQRLANRSRTVARACAAMAANRMPVVWDDRHAHIERVVDSIYGRERARREDRTRNIGD